MLKMLVFYYVTYIIFMSNSLLFIEKSEKPYKLSWSWKKSFNKKTKKTWPYNFDVPI
jgi:hypothetical protein